MSVKPYLVTGSNGFIAKELSHYLALRQYPVIQINRQQFKLISQYLVRYKPSVIFHLAGGRASHLSDMIEGNINTTVKLCEAVKKIKGYHPRIIIVGSAAEYGQRSLNTKPILENSITQPDSPYGLVKLMQTNLAQEYALQGLSVIILRLFNIIGPGVPESMASGRFVQQILQAKDRKKAIIHVGNLSGVRDFLDIRDVVKGLLLAAMYCDPGKIYNLCSGQAIRMRILLRLMIKHGPMPTLSFVEDKQASPGVLGSLGSCEAFIKCTRFKPDTSLIKSIKDSFRWDR